MSFLRNNHLYQIPRKAKPVGNGHLYQDKSISYENYICLLDVPGHHNGDRVSCVYAFVDVNALCRFIWILFYATV